MDTKIKRISLKGLDLIKSFESFSDKVYICPAGYKTIGFGHVVKEGENFEHEVSLFEAERLLYNDAQFAEHAVMRLIQAPLTQHQFDALVSFTFNLGSGALQRSKLRRIVNREEHEDVPQEFLRWVWAGGRKLKGLIRRRQAEGALYSSL